MVAWADVENLRHVDDGGGGGGGGLDD